MRDDPAVISLVAQARDGDQRAWDEIVDRYAPLVWAICRRYQLGRSDTDDVAQTVWLLLVEQLGKLRQPAALPGWIATTTARECLRVLRRASRYDHNELPGDGQFEPAESPLIEQEMLAAELNAAVRAAFTQLPGRCRELLAMLISDPPASYAQISATLSIRIGSIGPQRARCLDRMRRSASLSAFTDTERANQ
jgi:RNA polymerase sigma factor (sigma-70 family)